MRRIYLKLSLVIMFASMGAILGGIKNRYYCTEEDKKAQFCTYDYKPVCGWFDQGVTCATKPCVIDADNKCSACAIPGVEYVIDGECPKFKEIPKDLPYPYFCKSIDRYNRYCPSVNIPVCGFTRRDCKTRDCLFPADNSCFGCANEQVLLLYKGACPDYPEREYTNEYQRTDNSNSDYTNPNRYITYHANSYMR